MAMSVFWFVVSRDGPRLFEFIEFPGLDAKVVAGKDDVAQEATAHIPTKGADTYFEVSGSFRNRERVIHEFAFVEKKTRIPQNLSLFFPSEKRVTNGQKRSPTATNRHSASRENGDLNGDPNGIRTRFRVFAVLRKKGVSLRNADG